MTAKPVGRPPKLFMCLACKKVLGSAAVRSHKCPIRANVDNQATK